VNSVTQQLRKGWRRTRALAYGGLNRLLAPFFGVITAVQTDEPVAALTFDDGPHPDTTPLILDILKAHNAKATFFVVGQAAKQHPEVLERIMREGHELGNHTFDHPSLPRLSASEIATQVTRCAAVIPPQERQWFRPPYGHLTAAICLQLRPLKQQVVTWTFHCEDWSETSAEPILERFNKRLSPGSIVLFHDALYSQSPQDNPDRTALCGALDALLRQCQDYRFMTLSELKTCGSPRYTLRFRTGDEQFFQQLKQPQQREVC
jgi:peptidoglycan/xylan/chitin deacetylase (PgdA/CDA1 family)